MFVKKDVIVTEGVMESNGFLMLRVNKETPGLIAPSLSSNLEELVRNLANPVNS